MKSLFKIIDTIPNKISYWHLVGFLVLLPFNYFYSTLLLIGFALHTIIHCRSNSFLKVYRKEVLLLIAVFIPGAVSILYSPDKAEGFNILSRQLAIVLIPVLFSLTDIDLFKYRLHLLKLFAFACTVTILYLYIHAINTIVILNKPLFSLFTLPFMNHNFSLPIEIHATYLSLYVSFSIVIFSYLLSLEKIKSLKYFYIACLFILTMGMLQLSSRAAFIALLLIINTVFLFFFRGRKRMAFSIVAIAVSLLLFFTILNIDTFKVRYINELKKDLTQKTELIETDESRMERWKAITELIIKSPVIGYGIGAEKELLKEKYFERKLFTSYINEFNTHNEYLSFMLRAGIPGLAFLIFALIYGAWVAIRKKDVIFLSFLLLIAIICVSENVLDLNKGIFFYSFFFSLFLIKDNNNKSRDTYNAKSITGNPI